MTSGPDDPDRWGDDPAAASAFDDARQEVEVDRSAPDDGAAVDVGSVTGNERVDDAVARLGELDTLATSEHADVYEDVHRRLHAALTELDDV